MAKSKAGSMMDLTRLPLANSTHATAAYTTNTSNAASTSPAVAYDDLQRHFYFAHLTPTSTTSSNDFDHRSYEGSWHAPSDHRYFTPHPAAATSTVPILKSEYSWHTANMASIPSAPPSEHAKQEYNDDVHFTNLHEHGRSRTPLDGRIEMDQDEVDAIIRNKRKVRDPKACYACHRRKVKCDRNLPCDSCVKRDHPELCSYERPTKKKRIALNNTFSAHISDGAHSPTTEVSSTSGHNITVPKEQWERINSELQRLRSAVADARQPVVALTVANSSGAGTETEGDEVSMMSRGEVSEREGIHAPSTQMGTMHLGSRSVLAYMVGDRSKSSQDAARLLLEENILPNLGLDNETATYPFVDLWSTETSISDVSGLCRALPEDGLILDFWTSYRDVACTIYPVVPDKLHFEQMLKQMLVQRAEHNRRGLNIDPTKPYGFSMPWLALVFSVLASGAQCGVLPAKERELTSQVYICCAYQALRMANFLSHPCLETIEACLIIGNALSYNMNPGVSYIFLGMTLRSALTMGLHVNSQKFSEHENYLRGRIWWALAWQDSHFSVSYDRPSSSILCFPDIPYTKNSVAGNRSYVESMSAIIQLTQEIVRDRTINPNRAMGFHVIQKYKETMSRIVQDAAPRLKDRALCSTTIEHMERCAFILHSSYLLSEICRPALKESHQSQPTSHPSSNTPVASPKGRRKSSLSGHSSHSAQSPGSGSTDAILQAQLRNECVYNLERVVEAYVDLHSHSIFACRSWVGIQRSISAAFLLGIVPETRQEPRILSLLMDLERCIAQRAAEDLGFADAQRSPTFPNYNGQFNVQSPSQSTGEAPPNWVRSMTKSLNALGKLNAALASSGGSQVHAQQPRYQPKTQSAQAAANMYVSPVVSPTTSAPVGLVNGQNQMSVQTQTHINQYPNVNLPPHLQHHGIQHHNQRLGSPTIGMGSPTIGNSSGTGYVGGPITVPMAPVTPESASSTGGDWHYGNLAERALEYVQPGLWG